MSETITITINGQSIPAKSGQMLIEVADANNITIPRFCYHKKLSVAANCRMCLVEVEKAPKPLPACATPVNDGMVVKTRSANAIAAQQSTMEFLLINHPLDCPICDQGGECELQDVAMGFGADASRYTEAKRVVCDKNIGPLISTELTRCILCTRCVRFGEEIAGLPELGATGRGESTTIGTYIEKSVTSELSGNVIDLCPVGALTAKPSRFTARAWELIQHNAVSPHDCVGTNLYVHTRNQQVIRVVPRDNESINEAWISDRDRFSYNALDSAARRLQPMVRDNGKLKTVDWQTAIDLALQKLQAAANQQGDIAALISPQCTLEEQFLLQKLVRGLGSNHIDHRLKQVDFSAQDAMPLMPWLGRTIESVDSLDAALLVAGNIRNEQPILNQRLRKAVVKNGADIASVSTVCGQYNYPLIEDLCGSAEQMLHDLAAIVVAAAKKTKQDIPPVLVELLEKIKPKKTHTAIASALISAEQAAIIVSQQVVSLSHAALLMQLVEAISSLTGATLGYLSESANSAGACLAGCLPHRGPAGVAIEESGHNTLDMFSQKHRVLLTMGLDARLDIQNGESIDSLAQNNEFIIAIDSFDNVFADEHADLILPLASFAETAGTYVNVEGHWQSFAGCVKAPGEARPGWKILTALCQELLPADDHDYADSSDVRNALKDQCRELQLNNLTEVVSRLKKLPTRSRSLQKISQTAIYAADALCRHARPLQDTANMQAAHSARMNAQQAAKLGLGDAEKVHIKQGEGTAILDLTIDDNIPSGCVWIASGFDAVKNLPALFGTVEVEKVS